MASKKTKQGNGEGSIYQRQDGRWVAQVLITGPTGRPQRKYLYGTTRRAVAQELAATQARLQQGLPPVPERLTVAQWVTHWLDVAVKPPARRRNTYLGYEVRVRQDIIPCLGHHRLAHLQPHHVEEWLRGLRERYAAPRTVQYAHAVLRAALEHALRQGLVMRNVAKLVEGVRVERPEVEPLEPETVGALLAAAEGDPLEAFYVVAIATGLRRGELLGLQWADVDLTAGEMHVRAQVQHGERAQLKRIKGRRIIPLAPLAVEALQQHRVRQLEQRLRVGEAWQDHGLIFPSSVGTPLNPANLWRHTRALLRRAGIPHHRLHLYRHTFASLHLAEGADLHEVSKLLGHSGVQITANVYGHLTRQVRQTAAARIERVLRQDGSRSC
jgi:integrase